MNIDQSTLESLIKQILVEKLAGCTGGHDDTRQVAPGGVIAVKVPTVKVDESNRLDTGTPSDVVYTKDLFTLEESPRLGCGVMEMKATTFDWNLNYDEIDYVIEGSLSININGRTVTANAGELVLIPKGSSIQFSVPNYARFIYVTYPADWAGQA
ncbi:MAG: cupin domain-containing protein [Cellulosilyticaceae bacterium]